MIFKNSKLNKMSEQFSSLREDIDSLQSRILELERNQQIRIGEMVSYYYDDRPYVSLKEAIKMIFDEMDMELKYQSARKSLEKKESGKV